MPASIDTEPPNSDVGTSVLVKLDQPHFDPVDFLNEALPAPNLSSQTQPQKASRSTQIQNASTETYALLSSFNTLNIRASSDLTSLTDEIIRSGNRLAYEVEVLRGDVNGLHDLLSESLRDDIRSFVQSEVLSETIWSTSGGEDAQNAEQGTEVREPEFMTQLRLLGKVKTRLEAVIALFGEAMKWPIPPSELSMASLISVSSPELGIQSTEEDDKAHEILRSIRAEITDLLDSESGGYTGLEAASRKVEEYRRLAMLWQGTAEERARIKFVDSLTKIVEDRKKSLDSRGGARNFSNGSSSSLGRNPRGLGEGSGAAGLFRNLQRLKDDLYLE